MNLRSFYCHGNSHRGLGPSRVGSAGVEDPVPAGRQRPDSGSCSGCVPSPPEDQDGRERVLALLERHGWNATSFQIMERGFHYWFDGDDACVGYVDTGQAWVAAGPPIAPEGRLAEASAR